MNEVQESKKLSMFQEGIAVFYAIICLSDGFILRSVDLAHGFQEYCNAPCSLQLLALGFWFLYAWLEPV